MYVGMCPALCDDHEISAQFFFAPAQLRRARSESYSARQGKERVCTSSRMWKMLFEMGYDIPQSPLPTTAERRPHWERSRVEAVEAIEDAKRWQVTTCQVESSRVMDESISTTRSRSRSIRDYLGYLGRYLHGYLAQRACNVFNHPPCQTSIEGQEYLTSLLVSVRALSPRNADEEIESRATV
jgi:hypothetical protein